MWSIIAVGLFNSIMFPTIFSLGLDGLGDDKPQGSGVLCTMIVGGAIIPPAYGFLTDTFNFNIALVLVIVCYTYIFLYGYLYKKTELIM
jgi:FHS family L-fucose permease-like MFS transporter